MAEIINDIEKYRSIDKNDMLSKAKNLPEMIEESWNIAKKTEINDINEFDNVVISGMGGSAISGDVVISSYYDRIPVPVYVNRSYDPPAFINEKTLFIAVSYSGNTEETLSSFEKAVKSKCKIVAVTSGGKLEKSSKDLNIPIIKIPEGLPPRAALGYILPSILYIFSKAKIADGIEDDIKESITVLKSLRSKYAIDISMKSNEVKQLAKKIKGKIPIIISSINTTYAAGLRIKTQLNENSKITAMHISFPELDHNDLVNIAQLKSKDHNYIAILLRDSFTIGRMAKRIDVTKSLISAHLKGINEISTQGKSRLAGLLSLIMFGDFLSIYLAILNGIDPTPVTIIEQLKKELAR